MCDGMEVACRVYWAGSKSACAYLFLEEDVSPEAQFVCGEGAEVVCPRVCVVGCSCVEGSVFEFESFVSVFGDCVSYLYTWASLPSPPLSLSVEPSRR